MLRKFHCHISGQLLVSPTFFLGPSQSQSEAEWVNMKNIISLLKTGLKIQVLNNVAE